MLKALRFVQGAIQKNGVRPELEYFQIKAGRIVGFNGYMALSSPIALDIEALPKASTFHKALQACGESVAIAQTPAGRLHIKSGRFSAFIPCIEQEIYEAKPEGETFPAPEGLAKAFKRILPFVSEDASRAWSMGVSVANGCLTATNNVIILQIWTGHQLPPFNCPRFAAVEIARLGEDPISIQVSPNSVTFHFADGKWLRTQRLAEDWPVELMNKVLSTQTGPAKALPDDFFEAVDAITPFVDEGPTSPVFFIGDALSTGKDGSQDGARFEVKGLAEMGTGEGAAFRLKSLQLLRDEVDTIDLTAHPRPCLFFGPNSRGAVLGMNV